MVSYRNNVYGSDTISVSMDHTVDLWALVSSEELSMLNIGYISDFKLRLQGSPRFWVDVQSQLMGCKTNPENSGPFHMSNSTLAFLLI